MMAVLSGIRMVRVLCVCGAVSCCVTACVRDMASAECAPVLLPFPGRSSTRRFVLLLMPMRRDCDKSVRESSNYLNRM